jgi:hypothetical protein
MSSKRKKTAVMTVRLSKELNDVLLEDAESNGITASSLVNRIVKKYVEWDRHAEKFRFVSIPAENFRSLLEQLDDKTIPSLVRALGLDQPEALTLFWFKKISLETVLETVNVLGKYSGLFVHEIEYKEGSHIITLRHGLGRKWSAYIGTFISEFIEKELNVVPETICTDETAVITFRMDSPSNKGSID